MSPGPAPARLSVDSDDSGSASDMDRLYAREASALTRFFRRRLDGNDTADHVQETFLRFAASDTCPERPGAFLNRIARNLAHDLTRRSTGRGEVPVSLEGLDLPGPDPVHYLETRDMLTRVERAIGQLRPKTREIFLAHRVEGLTYAEIACASGISVKGVEKQMSKAIAAIDRLLARSGR